MSNDSSNGGGTTTRSRKPALSTETLRKDVRAIADDAATLGHDAGALAKQEANRIAHTMKGKAEETLETVVEKSHELADHTREMIGRSREVLHDEYDRTLSYVRANPLTSILVGVAVGAVIGSILRGRGE